MADLEQVSTEPKPGQYVSTSYSGNIRCGICGAPVSNIPVMYERMNIDWRCAKCLRRDKPTADDHNA